MPNLHAGQGRPVLPRPRLLPVTIVAMSALLAVKSAALVKAAAEEAVPAQAAASPRAAGTTPAFPSPARAGGAQASTQAGTGMQPAPQTGQGKAAGEPSSAGFEPVSDAERSVLLDLRHRRSTLDDRGRALDQREAELDAADRRLTDRVQQLSALQTRLEALEAGRQQHSAENWAGLVKVYETMKPRDAATIFDVLDMQVLLQVLDRMQERRAAPVLAAMQPDRARLATQMLAEMRTRAVTPPSPTALKD